MVFAPGPIFANIVLADEINRTPPKTQSALLEAMQEHRVTVQGKTYQLAEPFYVFATQNPIELEGTYPLPEAQLDRFMFHIIIEHPPYDEELGVVRTTTAIQNPQLERPVTGEDLVAFQSLVRKVPVAEPVMRHALDIVRATRPKNNPDAKDFIQKWVAFGASVRAAQYLVLGGKARALTSGRYHVSFDDIRALAHPVLRHRIITNFHAQSEGVTTDAIVDRLLESVPLPAIGDVMARRNARHPRRPASWIPLCSRASGTSSSSRARSPTGSSTGCTRRRTSARPSTSRSIAATCPATTSAGWTGGCGRARTATTSRSTRPRRT